MALSVERITDNYELFKARIASCKMFFICSLSCKDENRSNLQKPMLCKVLQTPQRRVYCKKLYKKI